MAVKGVISREGRHANDDYDEVDCRWKGFELPFLCFLDNGECMREFFEPHRPTSLFNFTTVVIPEEFI